MTHQENIARSIATLLAQDAAAVAAFCKGNPFDKIIRSFDEHTATGLPLYKKEAGRRHYKMSAAAFASQKPVKELYGEHKIPVSCIIKKLLTCDRSYYTVLNILRSNEVVLITKEEARYLDRPLAQGVLGLKRTMPADGICRLEVAQIAIAPATANNCL